MGKKLNKKENEEFWKEVTKQKKVETLNLFEWYQKSKWKPFLKTYYNYDEIQSLELHHDHEYNDNWYEYRVTSFTLLDNEGRKIPEIDFDSSYEIDDMSPDEYESKYWDDYWECQKDTPLYNEYAGSDYKPKKTNVKIIFKCNNTDTMTNYILK